MKTLIASIAILGVVGTGVFVGAGAATEANVSATVTAELISITVADGSVAYGTLAVSTNADTVGLGQTQVVTNEGNVDVDLGVKSSDADGGTAWNLVAAVGSLDEFTHEFSSNNGGSWASFNVDNTTYASLETSVTTTQDLDLRIKTPTSITDGTEKTITITVLATQS